VIFLYIEDEKPARIEAASSIRRARNTTPAGKSAMSFIKWTDELSVGVESLDADHKILISLLNQLDDAVHGGEPRETVERVLDALVEYTDYHFRREEALMRAVSYPEYDAHVRTHSTLRAQVTDIRERYRRNPESIHAREVLSFLRNWLSAHILGRDHRYMPFMDGKRREVAEANSAYSAETKQPIIAIAASR
jgi:hemerythrin